MVTTASTHSSGTAETDLSDGEFVFYLGHSGCSLIA